MKRPFFIGALICAAAAGAALSVDLFNGDLRLCVVPAVLALICLALDHEDRPTTTPEDPHQ